MNPGMFVDLLQEQMREIRAVIFRDDKLSEDATTSLDLREHHIDTQTAFYRLAAAEIFHLAEVLADAIEKSIKIVASHGQDIVIAPAEGQEIFRCERGVDQIGLIAELPRKTNQRSANNGRDVKTCSDSSTWLRTKASL
ncbi:uncharacterized protein DFL_009743 [Arthrobotrys flagrans]|uniref:Uncharacterized protein n=1 Tax=Arthrobotrys flagrans TaxID=97331 RepID=A0A436ZT23_ARTFL|nr:hypothetical protein DFL_009743 [Arthrobotrys flagrans]